MAGSAKPAGWAAPVLMLLLIFVSVMTAITQGGGQHYDESGTANPRHAARDARDFYAFFLGTCTKLFIQA
jgi:hypothetical protein